MSERLFVLTERELSRLLEAEMTLTMLETDGVDNWSWYGESRREIKQEFYPGDWDELSEDEQFDTSFEDIVKMRLDAGEYREFINFDMENFLAVLEDK